jgi:hypothetical protein
MVLKITTFDSIKLRCGSGFNKKEREIWKRAGIAAFFR